MLSITKLDRSVLLNIFAYGMVGFIFVGIQGVLTNLYLIELGLDLSFIGSLTASGMLIWAILSLPTGMIGARFGTRAAVIAGFVLVSVGLTLYLSVARLPPPLWETGFYLTNALIFIGAPLVAVNGIPYLMGVAPEHERNAAFTLLGALNAIAAFSGSLVAGFLPGVLIRVSNGSLALSMGVAGMVGGRIIPMIGFSGMFTIGAALALLAVLLYSIWQLKPSHRLPVKTQVKA